MLVSSTENKFEFLIGDISMNTNNVYMLIISVELAN